MKLLFSVITYIFVAGLSCFAEVSAFNGHWWNSVSYDRQLGFISGESDCYMFELNLPRRYFRSADQTIKLLNRYYMKKENLDKSTKIALAFVAKEMKPYPDDQHDGAATHPEKHGYYDGLWWKGGDPKGSQLGFIEYPSEQLHS